MAKTKIKQSVQDTIRAIMESVDQKSQAQLTYPGAANPQDPLIPEVAPAPVVVAPDEEGNVPAAMVQQAQYPTSGAPQDPIQVAPYVEQPQDLGGTMAGATASAIQQPEQPPMGFGAEGVGQVTDPTLTGDADPEQITANVQQAAAPAPGVAYMESEQQPQAATQQQVDPTELLDQAVQAVQAGNDIEQVAKATGLTVQQIKDGIDAAQPTKSTPENTTTAPVTESFDGKYKEAVVYMNRPHYKGAEEDMLNQVETADAPHPTIEGFVRSKAHDKGSLTAYKTISHFPDTHWSDNHMSYLSDAVGAEDFHGHNPTPVTESVDMGQADSSLRRNPHDNGNKMVWTRALKLAAEKMGYGHYFDVPPEHDEKLRSLAHEIRGTVTESTFRKDIENIISEEADLSDTFKSKAAALFESAVIARVNAEKELIESEVSSKLNTQVQQLQEQYEKATTTFVTEQSNKLSKYVNYLGGQWIEQNKVAVVSGLRAELTESFMSGLKQLFESHYINVPETKYDLVEEQAEQIKQLQEQLTEATSKAVQLEESVTELKRAQLLNTLAEGLADTQKERLATLCEGVQFETPELFTEQVEIIKKTHFGTTSITKSPEQVLIESTQQVATPEPTQSQVQQLDPYVAMGVKALGKWNR